MSGKTKNIRIHVAVKRSIHIDASVEEVWRITALDFAGIYKWQAGVNASSGQGSGPNGATCEERVCKVNVNSFSETRRSSFPMIRPTTVLPIPSRGLPSFFKDPVNEWVHEVEGDGA